VEQQRASEDDSTKHDCADLTLSESIIFFSLPIVHQCQQRLVSI